MLGIGLGSAGVSQICKFGWQKCCERPGDLAEVGSPSVDIEGIDGLFVPPPVFPAACCEELGGGGFEARTL